MKPGVGVTARGKAVFIMTRRVKRVGKDGGSVRPSLLNFNRQFWLGGVIISGYTHKTSPILTHQRDILQIKGKNKVHERIAMERIRKY